MMKYLKLSCRIITFILLTILTQIGGIVYILVLLLDRKLNTKHPIKKVAVFMVLYLIATFVDNTFYCTGFWQGKSKAFCNNTACEFYDGYLKQKLCMSWCEPIAETCGT